MQKVGDMVQDISKQMDSVVITTEAIHKTTQKMAEELDFLVSFARNDLQDWLHREKADLAPKLLPDDDSNEETINHFADKLYGYVESHVQTADELVARETEHLQLLFGAHWERFLPETRTALVSGEVLWHRCADITVDAFDFSGVWIAFTTALEAELRRIFFTGLSQLHGRTLRRTRKVLRIPSISGLARGIAGYKIQRLCATEKRGTFPCRP